MLELPSWCLMGATLPVGFSSQEDEELAGFCRNGFFGRPDHMIYFSLLWFIENKKEVESRNILNKISGLESKENKGKEAFCPKPHKSFMWEKIKFQRQHINSNSQSLGELLNNNKNTYIALACTRYILHMQ